MKFSKYNFLYPFDDEYYALYNAFSNALGLIEQPKYKEALRFCKGDGSLDEATIDTLKVGHFIIDDEVDELELLRFRLLQSRFSSSSLSLTIAPTSDCNFACVYCFEKERISKVFMSDLVQERILNFVKSKIEGIRSLQVSWYGGEPLMAMPIIQSLTDALLAICAEHNVAYQATMVTNGYLLSRKIAGMFESLHITGIQITIDGSEEVHNKRRPLINGKPTYRKIVDNLIDCKETLTCSVALRINVDKTNASDADRVLAELRHHNLERRVRPYVGQILNINGQYADGICYDSEEFSEIELSFFDAHDRILEAYPVPRGCFCCADSASSFVINADGKMYRCWSDIGIEERSYYDLAADRPTENYGVIGSYLNYDATQDDECMHCKYIPLCMGGCPDRRLRTGERCASIRHSLEAYMMRIPQLLRER